MTDLQKDAIFDSVKTLLALVLETNGYEKRQREYTGALPTVYFNYSGHVNSLTIRIQKDGWESGRNDDREWWITLDKPIPDKTMESILEYCASCLEDKKESEIVLRDISRLEAQISQEKESLKFLRKKYRRLVKQDR